MALVVLLLPACGALNSGVRGLGKSATEGMAEGLPKMKQPLKQLLRESLLEDDTLKLVTEQATAAALESLLRELTRPEMEKRIDGLVGNIMTQLEQKGSGAVRELMQTAGPELREALKETVRQTMATTRAELKAAIENDLTPATQVLAQRTADTLVTALVKALEGPLGEAMHRQTGQAAQEAVTQATLALSKPESRAAIAAVTESAMHGAVRGARAEVVDGLPPYTQAALIAGLVVMGVLLLLSGVGAYTLWHHYQQSTTSLAIVAEKINQHDSEASTQLKRSIQQSATDNHVGPWLSRFLKKRGL